MGPFNVIKVIECFFALRRLFFHDFRLLAQRFSSIVNICIVMTLALGASTHSQAVSLSTLLCEQIRSTETYRWTCVHSPESDDHYALSLIHRQLNLFH